MWKTFLNNILNLFFPVKCINCHKLGKYICQDCLGTIDILENQYCPFCYPPKTVEEGTCHYCQNRHYLDGIYSSVSFNSIIKKAIKLYKNPPFIKDLSEIFSFLIIAHLKLLNNKPNLSNSILVPLPLSEKKRIRIGYNPSEELAKNLSKKLNIPIKNLFNQNKLEIKGNFKELSKKKILLTDLIFTINSNMDEAAKILKKNGVQEVWGITLTRK